MVNVRGMCGAIVLAAATLAAVPATAGGSTAHHTARVVKLAQEGRGTFWECPAKTTELLVGVNRLTLHPGDTLKVDFVVKNLGTTACNYVAPYASVAPGPTTTTLQAGPCGSMGFQIDGPHHKNVWPGTEPLNCPALGFAQLQPQAAVIGVGQWGQTLPTGTKRIPAGSYTLVVGHFSFPLKIDAH
jgi:hypothetical protein